MKKNRPFIIVGFVLYGLTAVIWAVICVRSLMRGDLDFMLILFTAFWIAWFFVQLRRYCNREEDVDG